MNSVSHGFKDSANGEVTINLTLKDGYAEIDYEDNDVGLDSIQQQKEFEPFYTPARSQGGIGLGMSICYNLVTNTLGGSGLKAGRTFQDHYPGLPSHQAGPEGEALINKVSCSK